MKHNMNKLLILLSVLLVSACEYGLSQDLYISNLDKLCLKCLCMAASNCNLTLGCENDYCGPFTIGRSYWVDAGMPTLDNDDFRGNGAFEDCATSYRCAEKVVKNYISRFGKDCNGDRTTSCEDFLMINFNGGYECHHSLTRNELGSVWVNRYLHCIENGGR